MRTKISVSIIFSLVLVLIILQNVSAQTPLKLNTGFNYSITCSYHGELNDNSTATLNVQRNDGTYLVLDGTTTNIGGGQYIKEITPDSIGTYLFTAECCYASECNTESESIAVTGNGKEDPSGVVIVLFSIVFLIIMGFLVYELIVGIGHFAQLDLDAVDLAKNMGVYFALFALYELAQFYLGNPSFESWMLLFIKIGAFTHVLVPITGFLISITIGSLSKKKVDFGTQRIYRRTQIGKV